MKHPALILLTLMVTACATVDECQRFNAAEATLQAADRADRATRAIVSTDHATASEALLAYQEAATAAGATRLAALTGEGSSASDEALAAYEAAADTTLDAYQAVIEILNSAAAGVEEPDPVLTARAAEALRVAIHATGAAVRAARRDFTSARLRKPQGCL